MISRELRKNIRETLNPVDYESLILFGSRARGDYTSESDFDLLVILKNIIPLREKINLSTRLRKRFAARMIDADILVKDNKDIRFLRDKPGSVVRTALLEGVTL